MLSVNGKGKESITRSHKCVDQILCSPYHQFSSVFHDPRSHRSAPKLKAEAFTFFLVGGKIKTGLDGSGGWATDSEHATASYSLLGGRFGMQTAQLLYTGSYQDGPRDLVSIKLPVMSNEPNI